MKSNTSLSNLQNSAFLVCVVIISLLAFRDGIPNIITWDTFGHYSYLPMAFDSGFRHNTLDYFQGITDIYQNTPYLYQFPRADNGYYFTQYTSGWAILYSPFYLIANLFCRISGHPNDGFSLPYQYAVFIGAWIYLLAGLYFTKKIIARFFDDRTTALTLIALVFGTNYLFTSYASIASSNMLMFSLVAFMIWQTIKFHETYSLKDAVLLGFAIGMIGLTRPPDIVIALLPLAWNLKIYGNLFGKIKFFFKQKLKQTLTIILIPFCLAFIQFAYWKITSGEYFINSYANNAGEGMDWFTPYVKEVLFSFRKGWLLYTPVMIFALIGMFIWVRNNPKQNYLPLLTIAIFVYIVSCWTSWWYAASFSQRAMIDIYPFLAIGLGAFISFCLKKRNIPLLLLMFLMLSLNLFQTFQAHKGILHLANTTKEYYFSIFGQTAPPTEEQKKLLIIDRIENTFSGFRNPEDYKIYFDKYYHFPDSSVIDSLNIYSPGVDLKVSEINRSEHFWLRATFDYEGDHEDLEGKVFNAIVLHGGKGYNFNGWQISDPLLVHDSIQKTISFNYLSPNFRSENDTIRLNAFHQNGKPLFLKGMRVQLFKPKE